MFEEKNCNPIEAANVVTKQGLITSLEGFESFWLNFPYLNIISYLSRLWRLQERPFLVNSLSQIVSALRCHSNICEPMSEICVLEALPGGKLLRSPHILLVYIYQT